MSSEYCSVIIDEDISKEEVEKEFLKLKEQAEYNYGHAGYTGTFAEKYLKPGGKIILHKK